MLKSIEMMQELQLLNQKAKDILENKDAKLEEIQAVSNEIKTLEAKISVQQKIEADEKTAIAKQIPAPAAPPEDDEVKNFVSAVRTKFKNAMSSGSNADGGYTVPQDIQTEINELRQRKDALQNIVTVEPVKTKSGSRVFKARAQQTGFVEVPENGVIAEKATPQFTQLAYNIKKYAGFFRVTNELLKDSDQTIRTTLVKWIGDESRVTRNKLIIAELQKKARTAIVSADDLKNIVNVQLDPAFQSTCGMVTNQDGFNWLDKLKDNEGRYLLQDSISSPSGKGFGTCDITVISNKDLPTVAGKAPIICGDLKEAVVLFDREELSIMASDVAMDAFETDNTLFRAIEREDIKTRDAEAFVYGEVTVA
jgi:HK97 family phage major capsid protein